MKEKKTLKKKCVLCQKVPFFEKKLSEALVLLGSEVVQNLTTFFLKNR